MTWEVARSAERPHLKQEVHNLRTVNGNFIATNSQGLLETTKQWKRGRQHKVLYGVIILGFTSMNKNFHNVSLGQGQEVVAEEAMAIAALSELNISIMYGAFSKRRWMSYRPKWSCCSVNKNGKYRDSSWRQ